MFVPQFHLHPAKFHGWNLDLHRHIGKFGLAVDTKLVKFITTHLFFIQQFLVLCFRTLKIEFQNRSAYLHAIASFFIDFKDTGVNRRIDYLFKSRNHLSRRTDTDFDHSFVDCRENNIFFFYSHSHQRDEYTDNNNSCHSYGRITNDFLITFFLTNFLRNFSVHIWLFMILSCIIFIRNLYIPNPCQNHKLLK